MTDGIKNIVDGVNTWLTTGLLDETLLHEAFIFNSPFWKQANRQAFLEQFLNPAAYQEAALSKIIKFDPLIHCISENQHYFTITLTYHTRNGNLVDETVLGEIKDNKLFRMTSIYDLEETRIALELI